MRKTLILGFVALSATLVATVVAVHANEAAPKQNMYGFGVSPRGVVFTDFGIGYEVGAVDCGGSARAAGIDRGDVLINLVVKEMAIQPRTLTTTPRVMEPINISSVSLIHFVRVATADVVRNGKVIERGVLLMFDKITGNNSC